MMFDWVGKVVSKFWKPLRRYVRMNRDGIDEDDSSRGGSDALIWCKDLEKHAFGDFSFAVVQANEVLEDRSQVEIGRNATFVGVYDGHGGPEASRYVCDHLFPNLIGLAQEQRLISEETLRNAFSATEDGFLSLVRRSLGIKPVMAAVGSCCLVGLIWQGRLHVGNLGDSRAVLGRVRSKRKSHKIVAEQITNDHNACMDEVRQELKSDHPDDPEILVKRQGVWRIKGIIQVSRTIGDAYLKRPEFALDHSFPRFHLAEPIRRPILRSDPCIHTRVLEPDDKFLVFASDGLWEHITNEQAVEMVYNNPRPGIARRLLKSAMKAAAKKVKKKYKDLKKLEKGFRRSIHDDITVVVIFIDHELLQQNAGVNEVSVQGFTNSNLPSQFSVLQGIGSGAQ